MTEAEVVIFLDFLHLDIDLLKLFLKFNEMIKIGIQFNLINKSDEQNTTYIRNLLIGFRKKSL